MSFEWSAWILTVKEDKQKQEDKESHLFLLVLLYVPYSLSAQTDTLFP